jgi:hypothetical protein
LVSKVQQGGCVLSANQYGQYMRAATKHGSAIAANSMLMFLSPWLGTVLAAPWSAQHLPLICVAAAAAVRWACAETIQARLQGALKRLPSAEHLFVSHPT